MRVDLWCIVIHTNGGRYNPQYRVIIHLQQTNQSKHAQYTPVKFTQVVSFKQISG